MKSRELSRQLQRIEDLIEKTKAVGDIELQAHWGRYLCILVAGFLENAIGEVYTDFVNRVAHKPIASFAASTLSRIQNPNSEKFLNTARAFKPKWASELEDFLAVNGRREAVDSIMANRHQIAHGQQPGITVARVRDYLSKCVEVIEFLENQCR